MATRLGRRGYAALKVTHLFFAGTWVGAGLCMVLVLTMIPQTTDVHAMVMAVHILDLGVAVPSAAASLLTGILFSSLTHWGFLRHRWIIAKYVINLVPVVGGPFCLAPWVLGMLEQSRTQGTAVLSDPLFLQRMSRFTWFVIIQYGLLLVAMYLSVFKPRLRRQGKQALIPPSRGGARQYRRTGGSS